MKVKTNEKRKDQTKRFKKKNATSISRVFLRSSREQVPMGSRGTAALHWPQGLLANPGPAGIQTEDEPHKRACFPQRRESHLIQFNGAGKTQQSDTDGQHA